MKLCPHHFFQPASRQWKFQRLTAVLLVPLSGWLLVLFHLLFNGTYSEILIWVSNPVNNLALTIWVFSVSTHAVLGIQVVLEDYVNDSSWRSRFNILSYVWFSLIALSATICLQLIFWYGGV